MYDECLGRGDIVQGDDALDLAADEAELAVAHSLDEGPVASGRITMTPSRRARPACLVDQRRHPSDELAHALPGDRRDHRTVPDRRTQLVGLHGVGLGADDDARPFEQLGFVITELTQQDPLLLVG